MGLVWRARDVALQRDVALKEVRPPDPDDTPVDSIAARELHQRVLREARALARLRHPNVVTIHHIVDTPEYPHPWLVMELVTGGSLADRLGRGPLTVPEAARIGRGVLSALRAAHSVGILHRDVKPGNVLLRPDGSPVLTDFGIAGFRDATALTLSGSLVGSPEYVAPERLRGMEGNPASDLWSLGMMLYVAIEGRHPLRRATMLSTLTAVLDEPLPPPAHAGPVLGPALSAVLVKDPAVRPPADHFDRMLAAAEGAAPPIATPVPQFVPTGWGTTQPHPPPRRPVRRRRVVLIAACAVVVLAACGLTFALLPRTPEVISAHGTAANRPTSHLFAPPAPAHAATTAVAPQNSAPQNSAPQDSASQGSLSPAGVRATVDAMSKVMGTKVFQLVIYGDHATAEAPTRNDPNLYDDIDFSNGVTTRSPGSTVDSDIQALVDLNTVNWNALPALLTEAQATLNVPHPTIVYVMVDTDMEITDSGDIVHKPVLRVYRADAYGGGMLEADLSGHVLTTVPRS